MALAYSFIRFSSGEQRKGKSLARQTELREAYLKKNPGLELDRSFVLAPAMGVSALRGKQRTTGALAQFLDGVKSGRVKPGSYLLVENLDRLSREEVEEAFELFLSIIRAGIVVVTLEPETEYRGGQLDLGKLVFALAEFCRGHSESRTKSDRAKFNWKKKREAIDQGETGVKTGSVPAWLKTKNGKPVRPYEIDPVRGETVKRVYALAAAGMGAKTIAKTLNREKVPVMGRGEVWHRSYVRIILANRAAIGEYQRYVMEDGKRVPYGAPILNHFPAVVTPEEFAAASVAVGVRKKQKGRVGQKYINLFPGMIRDGEGVAYTPDSRNDGIYLASSRKLAGTGKGLPSVPYTSFERAVLSWLVEVQLDPRPDDPLPGLKAQEAEAVARLEVVREKSKGAPAKMLGRLLEMEISIEAELEEIRRKIEENTTPAQSILRDIRRAVEYLDTAEDPFTVRLQLRQHIGMLLRNITVDIRGETGSRHKTFFLTVQFANGDIRRIWFKGSRSKLKASGLWDETLKPNTDREFRVNGEVSENLMGHILYPITGMVVK